MKTKILFILSSVVLILSGCSESDTPDSESKQNAYSKTASFYQSLISGEQPDIANLNQFLTNMPKGGDIHHHYSGSVYAETYLDWVQSEGGLINSCDLTVEIKVDDRTDCKQITVAALRSDTTLYRKLLTLWSDKDYENFIHLGIQPDLQFFNTFTYFGHTASTHFEKGLKVLKQRAIKENISYIETMLSAVGIDSADFFSNPATIKQLNNKLSEAKDQKEVDEVLSKIDETYFSNQKFSNKVDSFVQSANTAHIGIDDEDFTMRFQTYAVRVLPPLDVYTDMLSGFLAADASDLIVGVNIVAPENNITALKDYSLHMRMFNYLHRKYPNVNRALHAGELTLGMVRPKNLLFHINQAVAIANAQRIGHGVDLPYESNSFALLKELKERDTAIEINLTSNQFILGVEGNEHPYLIYSKYDVPLVITTDDSGVSRNNLSNEYMLLASRYKPSYATIKSYVYNSISYSFLDQRKKEELKDNLDKRFAKFEQQIADLSDL